VPPVPLVNLFASAFLGMDQTAIHLTGQESAEVAHK